MNRQPQDTLSSFPPPERAAISLIELFAITAFKDDHIRPTRVWDRVLSATMSIATAVDEFGQFIEGVADKLQIASFYKREATTICKIRQQIGQDWETVRRLLETQTRYLVGMTRAIRDEAKTSEAAS
jgi:hypothetical protein